jgi:sugar phosphate isomerase/epimerase
VVVPGRRGELSEREATALAAASLHDVLDCTERAAVPLAIEPVREVDFANTLDGALDLVELVDHPRLGVLPDVFHVWDDPGIDDALERAGSRILGVHIADQTINGGDPKRVPPGSGSLPLEEFVASVDRTGYRGTYDIELFAWGATEAQAGVLLGDCASGMRRLLATIGR